MEVKKEIITSTSFFFLTEFMLKLCFKIIKLGFK